MKDVPAPPGMTSSISNRVAGAGGGGGTGPLGRGVVKEVPVGAGGARSGMGVVWCYEKL